MIEITKKPLFTTLIVWEARISYRRIWKTKKILEHQKKFAKKFFVFIFSFYLRPIVKLQKWVNGKFCSVSKKSLIFSDSGPTYDCQHCVGVNTVFWWIFLVFEQYQKSRTQFVQTIAELSTRPQNIETLQAAGVMQLLRPLLLDIVPTVQQTAALALGRLANHSDDMAEAVVKSDILPQLIYSLGKSKCTRANVLTCICVT